MDAFVIDGGRRLKGEVTISGSKNASLPIMAAALMTAEPIILRDVPCLRDIANMRRLLHELGCETTTAETDPNEIVLESDPDGPNLAPYDIVSTMRAGICVLGPLTASRGEARVSMPGGCAIGDRPVDIHLRGMAALGAEVSLDEGDIVVKAPRGGLRGATVFLGGPFGSTVLGTANVMSAAVLAKGTTVIESAACEPEIVDLASLLTTMGARIRGAGTPRIVIDGVESLGGAEHRIMPDRIEAGTYMVAAAITNGELTLGNCPYDCLLAAVDRLERIGVSVRPAIEGQPASSSDGVTNLMAVTALDSESSPYRRSRVTVESQRRLSPVQVTTQPHPGYPTDLQAQLMALLCLADGNSIVTERIFPERFLHVAELGRMGAKLYRQGQTVVVSGVDQLRGARVMASELRASAGLVLAGLAAEGSTTVHRVYHLDRGYETMERKLSAVGAEIKRVDEEEVAGGS
ncbi:MAG: UDP-N-acetylglucosamine 1-carboxyvinyltransferase [Planctomycetes bacterium]|nr:UDP-N-acetylglucosamine 1-carboxyvinyltransferase [Planctomycetota bacterium]